MSELRHNKDGSVTIGPVDKYQRLVENLTLFAEMSKIMEPPATQREALRRLAWFLGDRGDTEAACAIMEHAKAVEQWTWSPWGAVPSQVP